VLCRRFDFAEYDRLTVELDGDGADKPIDLGRGNP
jgi:hypothetical protein